MADDDPALAPGCGELGLTGFEGLLAAQARGWGRGGRAFDGVTVSTSAGSAASKNAWKREGIRSFLRRSSTTAGSALPNVAWMPRREKMSLSAATDSARSPSTERFPLFRTGCTPLLRHKPLPRRGAGSVTEKRWIEVAYAESRFKAPEIPHHYGPGVHLLDDPLAWSLLARFSSPDTGQPDVGRLVRTLYEILARAVLGAEFPRARVDVPTRMVASHPEAVSPRQLALGLLHARRHGRHRARGDHASPSQVVYDLDERGARPRPWCGRITSS